MLINGLLSTWRWISCADSDHRLMFVLVNIIPTGFDLGFIYLNLIRRCPNTDFLRDRMSGNMSVYQYDLSLFLLTCMK